MMIYFRGEDGRLLLRASDIAVVSEQSWNDRDGNVERQTRLELSNGSMFPVKDTWERVVLLLTQAATRDGPILWGSEPPVAKVVDGQDNRVEDDGTSSTSGPTLKDVLSVLDDDEQRRVVVGRLRSDGFHVPQALYELYQ